MQPSNKGASPRSLGMRAPGGNMNVKPVRARILWPALGFPAVIAPRQRPSTSPFADGDATRCICVLVLTDRQALSKAEAARYLRYVSWDARGRRHIPANQPGSFREEELAVRNEDKQSPLVMSRPKDARSELVGFGGDAERRNRIVASLGKRVREVYEREGLRYLHEIRVYEAATARLPDGKYHLFWNNEVANEQAPSDEMALLLRAFARPRRASLGAMWTKHSKFLMQEYEYEYGELHRPYKTTPGEPRTRSEILHPLFVRRAARPTLRIGQLTDIHVDVRTDVYEENLKQERVDVSFSNWNKSFVRAYEGAKADSDAILLTGDLVDYGRGHMGVEQRKTLGDDASYHVDRNWFYFQYLLSSGNAYTQPTYTILGNHDWRINPYPPLAFAGAPSVKALIDSVGNRTDEQQKDVLRAAHGAGHERSVSYNNDVERKYSVKFRNAGRIAWQILRKMFGGEKTMDIPGFPTETIVNSIAWYLLSINPFLDYWFSFPTGQKLLMLDWAEDESVLLGDIYQGKRYGALDKRSGDEGPKAKNCLSELQVAMVKEFTELPGRAKIIGIHAPPIGPWDNWYDHELRAGWKEFDIGGRGYPFYTRKTANGKETKGHPLFAVAPAKGVVPDAVNGMDASYNSFEENRPWFIKRLADPRFGVRLVLSGHIHRKGAFVVYKAPASWGPAVAGELLIKAVSEGEISAAVRSAASPLYLNGTSVGPRGHSYPTKGVSGYIDPGYAHIEVANDGTISNLAFRWLRPAQMRAVATPPSITAPSRAPARSPTVARR